ncbi:hypothetical protein NC651_018239 [Populus alba x Populus x berolinensis]|nr:hypothetical protein NC651_018239 [Populus alba x Populus x berolinensis]
MPSPVCVSLNVVHPIMVENRDFNQGRRHYMTCSRARNLATDTAIISTGVANIQVQRISEDETTR